MPRFKIKFHKLIQDAQEYGSDNEYMVSRVFFSLEEDGKAKGDFCADLKQVVGSDFETGDIEVSPPRDYDGAFDHQGFTAAATKYFRSQVGAAARGGIHIVGGKNIRMYKNEFTHEAEFTF